MKHLFALMLCLLSLSALGDTWFYKPEVTKKKYLFGATEIELITDTTKNSQYPDFTLKVFTGTELQAIYRGISFQYLFADKTNSTFVGLSNSGLPGTAVVIFGSRGQLKKLVHHGEFSPHYCQQSVTIRKEWVHATDPKVEFTYESIGDDYEYIDSISFVNCKNERRSLFDEIRNGLAQRAEEINEINARK